MRGRYLYSSSLGDGRARGICTDHTLQRLIMVEEQHNKARGPGSQRSRRVSWPQEVGGAFGDLGTLIPHSLGAISVAGVSPVGVFTGFGALYVAAGLFYRLPIPVQPMKAVSAILLTSGLTAGEIAATGVLIGAALIFLGVSGLIGRLARAVPQTVTTGLQLGLGVSLGWLGVEMMAEAWWLGAAMVIALVVLMRVPLMPSTLIALLLAVLVGQAVGLNEAWPTLEPGMAAPALVLPGAEDLKHALGATVLPQLALTVTNAIIVTAAMSREMFGGSAGRATPVNLALSSGIANVALAPLGALPMCHGAGGLAAHYRFGARTGAATAMIGIALLALGLIFSHQAAGLIALVPFAAVGALLLFSAVELAWTKRLTDARPECLPVIGATACVTVLADPFWGLSAGWGAQLLVDRFRRDGRRAVER